MALKPGIRGDFVLSKEMYLSARVYYNIQFFVGTKTECGSNVNLELQPKNSINLDFAISIPF